MGSRSKAIKLGPHWHGFISVTRFMAFGDSFTDVGYRHGHGNPSTENPLGIVFPGVPWTEEGKPNWVGHLITKHCPHPHYDPTSEKQSEDYRDHLLLVYNYARGGDRVSGVAAQIQRLFLPEVGKKPEWAPWGAHDSLFLTWVGINDCASSTRNEGSIKSLFELQDELYTAGARNFLFIDVPPVHKGALAFFMPSPERYGQSRDNWNELLENAMNGFAAAHNDATVLFFSSTATFTQLMEDPEVYGFTSDSVQEFGGAMWQDHIHPTSRVHDFLANDLAEFLKEV